MIFGTSRSLYLGNSHWTRGRMCIKRWYRSLPRDRWEDPIFARNERKMVKFTNKIVHGFLARMRQNHEKNLRRESTILLHPTSRATTLQLKEKRSSPRTNGIKAWNTDIGQMKFVKKQSWRHQWHYWPQREKGFQKSSICSDRKILE